MSLICNYIPSFHPLSFCFGYRAAANPASSSVGAKCGQLWLLILKSVEIRISCRYFADPEKFPACTKPDCLARYCHLPHSEDFKPSRILWHFLCIWTYSLLQLLQSDLGKLEWRSRRMQEYITKYKAYKRRYEKKNRALKANFPWRFVKEKCGTTRRKISKEPGGGHAASISNMDNKQYLNIYTSIYLNKETCILILLCQDHFCRLCSFYHDAGSLMTRLRPNVVQIVEIILKVK